MSNLTLGTGQIVTASFENGQGWKDQNCIENECECPEHENAPLPAGTYITVRLDDPNAAVGIARVNVEVIDQ